MADDAERQWYVMLVIPRAKTPEARDALSIRDPQTSATEVPSPPILSSTLEHSSTTSGKNRPTPLPITHPSICVLRACCFC